jgi:hypothetical protein
MITVIKTLYTRDGYWQFFVSRVSNDNYTNSELQIAIVDAGYMFIEGKNETIGAAIKISGALYNYDIGAVDIGPIKVNLFIFSTLLIVTLPFQI